MSPKKPLVLLLVLVMMSAIMSFGVRELIAARRTLAWPAAAGVIQRSDGSRFEDCIEFSYTVASQAHSATTVHYGDAGTKVNDRSPSCQSGTLARYPAGAQVQVYYDPSDPSRAVLERGASTMILVVIGFPGLFVVVLLLALWQELEARRTVSRSDASWSPANLTSSAPPMGIDELLASRVVTPSEVVAIYGARFAPRGRAHTTTLVDGKTHISARPLAFAELRAAFLTLERAGVVSFEMSNTSPRTLTVVPTGVLFAGPAPSTESRLAPDQRAAAKDVVRRWLNEPAYGLWAPVAERTFVPMTLRNAVRVAQSGSNRHYPIADPAVAATAAGAVDAVTTFLRDCEAKRPDVWTVLTSEIEAAVDEIPASGWHPSQANLDPWYHEAERDVTATPGLTLRDGSGPSRQARLFGGIFWLVVIGVAYAASWGGRAVLAVAALLAAGAIAAAHIVGADISRLLKLWKTLAVFTGPRATWGESAIVLVPLVALAAEGLNAQSPTLALGAGIAGVLVWAWWILKHKARQAISHEVTSPRPRATARPATPPSASTPVAATANESEPALAAATSAPPVALPFDLEIVTADRLAPPSEISHARLRAVRERGPRVRALYVSSARLIAAIGLAVGLVAWLVFDAPAGSGGFPWFSLVICGLSLAMLSGGKVEGGGPLLALLAIAHYASRYLRGGAALERTAWEREITPIRPFLAPVIGTMWLVFIGLRGLRFWGEASTVKWVPLLLSVAAIVWYVRRLRRGRAALEREYPAYPALSLLVLRVFDSANQEQFVDLLDLWHWFGPLYRLDGPDTTGEKSSDVFAFVTGRLDKAITENTAELSQAVREFSHVRDAQLRFESNSIQCNDATWKRALQRMLERADVVVMNLSGLAEHHRGCAYELETLINDVPRERVLLLINGDTDVDYLRRLIASAAASRPDVERRPLRVFDVGLPSPRRPNESVYEWQRRTGATVDADRVIGLLCDTACAMRPVQAPMTIPWTRPAYRSAPVA